MCLCVCVSLCVCARARVFTGVCDSLSLSLCRVCDSLSLTHADFWQSSSNVHFPLIHTQHLVQQQQRVRALGKPATAPLGAPDEVGRDCVSLDFAASSSFAPPPFPAAPFACAGDEAAGAPEVLPHHCDFLVVCFITAGPITKLFAWGEEESVVGLITSIPRLIHMDFGADTSQGFWMPCDSQRHPLHDKNLVVSFSFSFSLFLSLKKGFIPKKKSSGGLPSPPLIMLGPSLAT